MAYLPSNQILKSQLSFQFLLIYVAVFPETPLVSLDKIHYEFYKILQITRAIFER